MGAVADWPRCCYMSRYMAQQHRLEFSMLDEKDVRSLGLLRLLEALSEQGGTVLTSGHRSSYPRQDCYTSTATMLKPSYHLVSLPKTRSST